MADPIVAVAAQKAVNVRWPEQVELDDLALCNVFNIQPAPDGVFITLGQASPPLLNGTPEEQAEILKNITDIEAKPLFRFFMSQQSAQQFVGAFAQLLAAAQATPAFSVQPRPRPERKP